MIHKIPSDDQAIGAMLGGAAVVICFFLLPLWALVDALL